MTRPGTPFPTTGYFGKEFFCDREDELEQLLRNVRGGSSTTLVALRRMGKTALIKHLQYHLRDDFFSVYVDILPTESMNDLLNSLATAVAGMVSERTRMGTKIWKFLRSLRPVVSYDSLSGSPTLSFNLKPEESQKSMGEIFDFLESQPKPVLLAIDEFQQILEYPEKQTDAWLRSKIETLGNVMFIFSGSQQHLMREIFADPSRPFYRSTQFLQIGKIERQIYHSFIIRKFTDRSKLIHDQTVEDILDWAEGYTYYVQLLCNRIFLSSGKEVHHETWKLEAIQLLKEQEFVFYSYRDILTTPQWNLLKAIAREGVVLHPTSSHFISRNHLGNAATVQRSLKALQNKDLIFREPGKEGDPHYGLYDVLFRRWIEA
ncbi:MAG: ATP-binding protein [Bacteroidota bacterium]